MGWWILLSKRWSFPSVSTSGDLKVGAGDLRSCLEHVVPVVFRRAEAFDGGVVRAGADAAGDILVAFRRVPPDAVQHPEQARVGRLGDDFRDAGHQVSRAHGMAFDVLMVIDGHIVLKI